MKNKKPNKSQENAEQNQAIKEADKQAWKKIGISAVAFGIAIGSIMPIVSCASNPVANNSQQQTTKTNHQSTPQVDVYAELNNLNHNLNANPSLSAYLSSTAISTKAINNTTKNVQTLILQRINDAKVSGFNAKLLQITKINAAQDTLSVQCLYDQTPINPFIIHGMLSYSTFMNELNALISKSTLTAPKSVASLLPSEAVNKTNLPNTINALTKVAVQTLSSNVNFNPNLYKITTVVNTKGQLTAIDTYNNQSINSFKVSSLLTNQGLLNELNQATSNGFSAPKSLINDNAVNALNNDSSVLQQATIQYITNSCKNIAAFNSSNIQNISFFPNAKDGTINVSWQYVVNGQTLNPQGFNISGFLTNKKVASNLNVKISAPSNISTYWAYIVAQNFNHTNPSLSAFNNLSIFKNNAVVNELLQTFNTNQNTVGFNAQFVSFKTAVATNNDGTIIIKGATYDNYAIAPIVVSGFVSTTTLINAANSTWIINNQFNNLLSNQITNDQLAGLSNVLNTLSSKNSILRTNFKNNGALKIVSRVNKSSGLTFNFSYEGINLPVSLTNLNTIVSANSVAQALKNKITDTTITLSGLNYSSTMGFTPQFQAQTTTAILNNLFTQWGLNTTDTLTLSVGHSTVQLTKTALIQDLKVKELSTNDSDGSAQVSLSFTNTSNNPVINGDDTSTISALTIKGFADSITIANAIATALGSTIDTNQTLTQSNAWILNLPSTTQANAIYTAWWTNLTPKNTAMPDWFNNYAQISPMLKQASAIVNKNFNSFILNYLSQHSSKENGMNCVVINKQTYFFNLNNVSFKYDVAQIPDSPNVAVKFNVQYSNQTSVSQTSLTNLAPTNTVSMQQVVGMQPIEASQIAALKKLYLSNTTNTTFSWTNQRVKLQEMFNAPSLATLTAVQFAQYINAFSSQYDSMQNNNWATTNSDGNTSQTLDTLMTALSSLLGSQVYANATYWTSQSEIAYQIIDGKVLSYFATNNPMGPTGSFLWPSVDSSVNGNGFVNGVNAATGAVALKLSFGSYQNVKGYPVLTPTPLTFANGKDYVIINDLVPSAPLMTSNITINSSTPLLNAMNQKVAVNGTWLKDETGVNAVSKNQLATTKTIITNLLKAANTNNPYLKNMDWNAFKIDQITSNNTNNSTGGTTYTLTVHASYNNMQMPPFEVVNVDEVGQVVQNAQTGSFNSGILLSPSATQALQKYTTYAFNSNKTMIDPIVINALNSWASNDGVSDFQILSYQPVSPSSTTIKFTFTGVVQGQTFTFHSYLSDMTSLTTAMNNLSNQISANLANPILFSNGCQTINHQKQFFWIGNYLGQNQGVYDTNASVQNVADALNTTWVSNWSGESVSKSVGLNLINSQVRTVAFKGISNFYGLNLNNDQFFNFANFTNNYHGMQYLTLTGDLGLNFGAICNLNTPLVSTIKNVQMRQNIMEFTQITNANVSQYVSDTIKLPVPSLVGSYVQSLNPAAPIGINNNGANVLTNADNDTTDFIVPNNIGQWPVTVVEGISPALATISKYVNQSNHVSFNFQSVQFTDDNLASNNIYLPNNTYIIEANAFNGVSTDTAIKLPASVVSVATCAFRSTVTVIPKDNSLQYVGAEAFDNAHLTGSLNLNNIIDLGYKSFANNEISGKFVIPASAVKVGAQFLANNDVNDLVISNINSIQFQVPVNNEIKFTPISYNYTANNPFLSNEIPHPYYDTFKDLTSNVQQETLFWLVALNDGYWGVNSNAGTGDAGAVTINSTTVSLLPVGIAQWNQSLKYNMQFNIGNTIYSFNTISMKQDSTISEQKIISNTAKTNWINYQDINVNWTITTTK